MMIVSTVGSAQPALAKDKKSCTPCTTAGTDCASIVNNNYYTLPNGSAPKPVCGPGNVEAGSQYLPIPADGGIALAKKALGM
jgi:hypothetical protein